MMSNYLMGIFTGVCWCSSIVSAAIFGPTGPVLLILGGTILFTAGATYVAIKTSEGEL